jgi:hypothetical protein
MDRVCSSGMWLVDVGHLTSHEHQVSAEILESELRSRLGVR